LNLDPPSVHYTKTYQGEFAKGEREDVRTAKGREGGHKREPAEPRGVPLRGGTDNQSLLKQGRGKSKSKKVGKKDRPRATCIRESGELNCGALEVKGKKET